MRSPPRTTERPSSEARRSGARPPRSRRACDVLRSEGVAVDGPTYESTHQLLLGLAGHVDDDLLSWVRELVAVGEEARAVSLVTAAVVAERIRLPEPVRAALAGAGRAARCGID